MRKTRTLMIASVASCLFGVLLLPDAGWAKPKKVTTWTLCKCTCWAKDDKGRDIYGNNHGVWYTTSHASCDVDPSCNVGKYTGKAIECDSEQQTGLKSVKPPSASSTR
jgi:hypothetical protein